MAKNRRHSHDDEHIDESWLIPYADLLTLLLALFIVLFASSSVDSQKYMKIMKSFNSVLAGGQGVFESSSVIPLDNNSAYKSQTKTDADSNTGDAQERFEQFQSAQEQAARSAQEETADLQKLKQSIDDYIQKNGLTTSLDTKMNRQQLVITIRDNALFPSGSASVKDDARKLALAIAHMLEQYPQYEIVVSGHTDDRPISNSEFSSNWDLSAKRAVNFMKILLSDTTINPARFSAVGYGEYRPIDSNKTKQGRAVNRRVEVSVLRNFQAEPDDQVSAP